MILTIKFIYERLKNKLNSKINVILVDDFVAKEPNEVGVKKLYEKFLENKYTRVIAIGGGTVIDIAKILVCIDPAIIPPLTSKDDRIKDLFSKKKAYIKNKSLIAIPTTCGTGSEVTNISIVEFPSLKTKMGLAEDGMHPDYAIFIKELFETMPFEVFMYSSIDALIHAMESFLAPRSNTYTELFSKNAIELIVKGYISMLKSNLNFKEYLNDFILASNYAGIAFGNTGVGAVHALSYPLGAVYHVAHGEANYTLLFGVLKTYEKKNPNGKILELKKILFPLFEKENSFEELEILINKIIKAKNLSAYGMQKSEIKLFAENVLETQKRLLKNNYTPLSSNEIENIYSNLY